MISYTTSSPILFLLFNRPQQTKQVFEQIRKVRPAKFYIAADGPRTGHPDDPVQCREARAVIDQIDWPCELKLLLREQNLGCRIAVSDAISWFFQHEEEGIILEDDCLPDKSFFFFCDQLLERYRFDERIHAITGTNLQNGKTWGEGSYYFSRYTNIWGWASWRRVWNSYDRDLKKYNVEDVEPVLSQFYRDRFLVDDWVKNFAKLKSGEIDTWDHQLNFLTFFENALCITPNVNLISNIGFGAGATHTHQENNHHANLPTSECWNIIHPKIILPQPEADMYFLSKEHHLAERWRIYNKRKNRFRRWLRKLWKD
ncbi:MAG: nucleotide-diphospho-sugar transferase [Citrobacter freundii]|nr:MAG: nucleotide-diphospho-sugar transferase [Citrobacter freundii]